MGLVVQNVSLRDFRSYEDVDVSVGPGLTILYGENGAGKTNVLEAMKLLSVQSPLRPASGDQLVREGTRRGRVEASLEGDGRKISEAIRIEEGKRTYSINGKRRRPKELKGMFPSVSFVPDDLCLAKGSNSCRRDAVDAAGEQLTPNYYVIRKDYDKLLKNKNRLLREHAPNDYLFALNDLLVTVGSQLTCYRHALFWRLIKALEGHYRDISGGKERISARYIPSWEKKAPLSAPEGPPLSHADSLDLTKDEARAGMERVLNEGFAEEQEREKALFGPHADRMEFFIDGKALSRFGSQGQQRCFVLAFKLAEMTLIREMCGQQPLLLLDDVMSELDAPRRAALMRFINAEAQTLVTTTTLDYFEPQLLNNALVVHVVKEKGVSTVK